MKHTVKVLETLVSATCNMGCTYCFEGKNKSTNSFFTFEQIKKFIDEGYNENFYVFGGEPLLNIDVIEKSIDYILQADIIKERKDKLLYSFRMITTNGTLIRKNIETIKRLKLRFQISIDGPKHINDLSRIFKSGEGSYDSIIDGIMACEENDIEWSLHSVLAPTIMHNYFDTVMWQINLYKDMGKSDEFIVSQFNGNWGMLIFEYDYSDEDIDIFLNEMDKITEWIISSNYSEEHKHRLYENIIKRVNVYAKCGAGRALRTIDTEENVYPCHRSVDELTSYNLKDDYCLGNLNDAENFTNFKFYNTLDNVYENSIMYSNKFILNSKSNINYQWGMWCPTANLETSGTEMYINSKYTLLLLEVDNFINIYLNNKFYGVNKVI